LLDGSGIRDVGLIGFRLAAGLLDLGNDGLGLYFILQNDGSLNIYQPTINVISGGSGAKLPRGAFWTMLPGG